MGILMEAAEVNLDTASYRSKPELFGAMGTPSEYFAETVHTIAINTRETEFGSIVEPIPLTLKAYKQYAAHAIPVNGYNYGHTGHVPVTPAPRILEVERPSTSSALSPLKEVAKDAKKITIPPPKKKWIKEYLEEEPKSPVSRVVPGLVSARSNGVVRPADRPRAASPLRKGAPSPALPAPAPADAPQPAPHPALLLDYVQEHSRPRPATTNLGSSQIPSPPSVSSNGSGSSGGSAPRAGTREVHNKLEKNRRAHLKECFELLKRQLPATQDDKKTSNLSILGSAIRYIQVLRRKERECEHEMERLAREKIAAQQRLAALKREVPPRPARSLTVDAVTEDKKDRDSLVNGQVAGMPINITSSPPRPAPMDASSPPHTLNLSTKLRTLPIQITPTTPQVVRTSYGSRHNTLTLTTLTSADTATTNGQPIENGVTSALSTALVHSAQIHLPISQVVGSSGVVVGSALQLVSAGGGLRVLRHAHNGITTCENNRIAKENGIASPPVTAETTHGVVVSGLTPLVVSQPASAAHLLHTHTIAQKVVETQVVKGGVSPLSVSTQYVSAAAIVKPVVVVSAPTPPRPHPPA